MNGWSPPFSLTIMSHPARALPARALAARLRDFAPAVSFDVDSSDTSLLGSAATAWRPVGGHAHHAVFQDDVTVHPGLVSVAPDLVSRYPDAVLSLFCEWGCKTAAAARIATLSGHDAVEVVDSYLPTNAVVAPRGVAEQVARELRGRVGGSVPDDVVAWEVARRIGARALLPLPNLVQHGALPSSVGNDGMGARFAVCGQPPAAAVPASRSPLTGLTFVPFLRWRTGQAIALRRAAGGTSWTREDLAGAAAAHGLSERAVRALAGSAADAARFPLLSRRGDLVRGLVLSLAATAMCAAAIRPAAEVTVETALAAGCLRTAAPGALRCLVPGSAQAEGIAQLAPLPAAVVRATLALLRAGELDPIPCRAEQP